MNVLPTAFTLFLLVFGLAFKASAESGVVYAMPGTQVQVSLEVETSPGLVVNRKNPPVVTLVDPFKEESLLTAEVTGEVWADDPETYFTRLDAVIWTISVPENAKPGAYLSMLEANFSLCSTELGVCFTEQREIGVTLYVGVAGSGKAAKVFLSTPDF